MRAVPGGRGDAGSLRERNLELSASTPPGGGLGDVADETQERLERYRKHAATALGMAAKSRPETARLFVQLADQWNSLADLIEQELADLTDKLP